MDSSTKKVSGELKWNMDIKEMLPGNDLSFPIFHWILTEKDNVVICQLYGYSFYGFFNLEVDGKEAKFISFEDLLGKINSYGWGEPPHIQKVFKDVLETKEKLSKDLGEFGQRAKRLRKKWKSLIV